MAVFKPNREFTFYALQNLLVTKELLFYLSWNILV